MFDFLDEYKPHGHWLLRIVLSSVFLIHGISSLMKVDAFASLLGVPYFFAFLVLLIEVCGGVLILTGNFMKDSITRLGALLLIPVVLIVMFMVHWDKWSFTLGKTAMLGSMESLTVLFLVTVYVLLKGNKT